jgi:hypothetical protein
MDDMQKNASSVSQSEPPSPAGEGLMGFPGANEESLGAYRRGYEDGVRELARRLDTYYKWLGGSKTVGYMVEYNIREKVKDMLGGNEYDDR